MVCQLAVTGLALWAAWFVLLPALDWACDLIWPPKPINMRIAS